MRAIETVIETAGDCVVPDAVDVVVANASAGAITVTLPVLRQGNRLRVKRNTNDHSGNTICVVSDAPDTQQFDADGDNGFNLGPDAFYDFIQQGAMIYVF